MLSDFHLHTSFSGDSETPPEAIIERAIQLGMKQLCLTDHYDEDFPDGADTFLIDFNQYFQTMEHLRERYASKIDLRIGVELGLQPQLGERLKKLTSDWPFDFIIGSSHLVDGQDPYYPEFFQGKEEEACYRRYFETIPENLAAFSDVDVYGHLDYVVRYGPAKNSNYDYERYADLLDRALQACVERGVGIEINTGGLAYGLGHVNPHEDVIRRYRSLGGEIVTIGSDAHAPERVGHEFQTAREVLLDCGFRYYTIFKNRKPEFLPLG